MRRAKQGFRGSRLLFGIGAWRKGILLKVQLIWKYDSSYLKLTESNCVAHKSDRIDRQSCSLTKPVLSTCDSSCCDAGGGLQNVGATEHCSLLCWSVQPPGTAQHLQNKPRFKPLLYLPPQQKPGSLSCMLCCFGCCCCKLIPAWEVLRVNVNEESKLCHSKLPSSWSVLNYFFGLHQNGAFAPSFYTMQNGCYCPEGLQNQCRLCDSQDDGTLAGL